MTRAYSMADFERDFRRAFAASVPASALPTHARGTLLMSQNDEPEPGGLTPEEVDRIAADLSYNRAKNDGSLERQRIERAIDGQVQRANLLEHLR